MKKLTLLIAGNVLAVCPLYQADLITDEDSYGVDKPLPKAQHSRICFLVMHYTITDKPAPEVPTGGNVITHDLIINLPPEIQGKPVALSQVPEPGRTRRAGDC